MGRGYARIDAIGHDYPIRTAHKAAPTEPKAMDLLAYLARHAGEIISEKRLVQALARRYSHDPEA